MARADRRAGDRGRGDGATLYELLPGQRSFPYHCEYGNEEWPVVRGRPTLRTPEGAQELPAEDVVCFPEGPPGGTRVLNATDEPVRILILST